jgi:hypothetical protein
MTHLKTLKATVCLAAMMSGSVAFADVTAVQVWEDWKEQMGIYGQNGVTIGDESVSGGTVTVSDIGISISDNDADITADLGTIVFEENGDGTVSITMSETYPISINGSDGSVKMSISQSGMSVIASGDPDALQYDISADRYAFEVDEITENGKTVEGDIRFVGNGLAGSYSTAKSDMRNLSYDMTINSLDVLVDVTDPDTSGTFLLSGKIDGLAADADIAMPLDTNLENPEDIFAAGFDMNGSYSLRASNYLFNANDDGDTVSGTVSTGNGNVSFNLDAGNMGYTALLSDMAIFAETSELPFPINISLAEYGANFQMPLSKSDKPSDFAFGLNLSDVTVNDEIWMMGDPAGVLPRDPATVKFDLTGTAKMFFDMMDPDQAEEMAMAGAPGELHSLQLNDLKLAIAGAEVTGAGAMTFDNSDMSTIPGFPRPEGDVTVNISGANQLIDSLVSMGLLPEDQAMMGRMMMGMFARTTGDDQLSSTIEFNQEGHILANVQRIKSII